MFFNINKVKISFTVPTEFVDDIRNSIFDLGVSTIGNYTNCSLSIKCLGSFRPNNKAHPFIGKKDKTEFVEEEKLEILCGIKDVKKVILKIKEIHPYEEVGIDIIPLLDEKDFN